MAEFEYMGMHRLSSFQLTEVGQRLEEKREGVIVGDEGVAVHAGVDGVREMRDAGVGEGSNEGIADEDMRVMEVGEEEFMGCAEKTR